MVVGILNGKDFLLKNKLIISYRPKKLGSTNRQMDDLKKIIPRLFSFFSIFFQF